MKLSLPDVTILCVAGNKHGESVAAIYRCLEQVIPAKAVMLTNVDMTCTGIEIINVGGLNTWEKYNQFLIKELYKYFDTEYCLIVQWDGYILDSDEWDESFLKFDYIGASWLGGSTGNGGFSMRSKKLQTILGTNEFIKCSTPEDDTICKIYREYLEKTYDIKYATTKVSDRFSYELNEPLAPTFGFHGFHWPHYRETVVIKRMFALGDVLTIEPIFEYFYKKGYQVSIDTEDYFADFFTQHYFSIVPKKHLNPKLPYKEIDLQMAYEVKPKQNHLQSYYEFAQVPEEERLYRNPILSLNFDTRHPNNKLFEKYVIFHTDKRSEAHRNININWSKLAKYFKSKGYLVVHIGGGKHDEIEGAVKLKTPTALFLMWVVGSSDLFCGIDSGISHVAGGFNIPSIIFTGSVDLRLIHADLTNKLWIHNHDKGVCNTPMCWHDTITQSGKPCVVDVENPPCVFFDEKETIHKIDTFLKQKELIPNGVSV